MNQLKSILLAIILCSPWAIVGYLAGKNTGFSRGADAGIVTTLDTVNKILDTQLKSDTSTITKLTLMTPKDTLSYILSKKIINNSIKN